MKKGRKQSKKFEVKIVWGSASTREENPDPSTYSFDTKAELVAFLEGVEEACGWSEYEIVEDEE